MQDDYEAIPEEYTEHKEVKHYPRLPSVATIAEYDLANDNHEMTRDAGTLLRILANPELFRKPEEQGRRGTRDSTTSLISGMFRITGSVSASASSQNKTESVESEHASDTSEKVQNSEASSMIRIYQPLKKVSAPPTLYTTVESSNIDKQRLQPKPRKPASFGGFSPPYGLPDIQEV